MSLPLLQIHALNHDSSLYMLPRYIVVFCSVEFISYKSFRGPGVLIVDRMEM